MRTINRSAIVVKPARPFLDWLHQVDATSRELVLEDLRREPAIYLLPEREDEDAARECLMDVCSEIFEEQLESWYRVRSTWPARRNFDTFRKWFEFSAHSVVVDLCDERLIQKES